MGQDDGERWDELNMKFEGYLYNVTIYFTDVNHYCD